MKVGDLVRSWGVITQERGIVVGIGADCAPKKYLGTNEYVKVQWSCGAVEDVGTFFLRTLSEVSKCQKNVKSAPNSLRSASCRVTL